MDDDNVVQVKMKYFNKHGVLPWHEGGKELCDLIIDRKKMDEIFGDVELGRIELQLVERFLVGEITCTASEYQLRKMMREHEEEHKNDKRSEAPSKTGTD